MSTVLSPVLLPGFVMLLPFTDHHDFQTCSQALPTGFAGRLHTLTVNQEHIGTSTHAA